MLLCAQVKTTLLLSLTIIQLFTLWIVSSFEKFFAIIPDHSYGPVQLGEPCRHTYV